MEIISNCAQKVPRFDAAKRLVPCTSHGALVEPATNKLCIEENNFGTEDHRFGSNAFPHTRTRRQAPPGTPFWTRSQQARSSRRASRSWPRRGTRRMSSISRRRMRGSNRRAFGSCRGTERADFAANFTLMFARATGRRSQSCATGNLRRFERPRKRSSACRTGRNPFARSGRI